MLLKDLLQVISKRDLTNFYVDDASCPSNFWCRMLPETKEKLLDHVVVKVGVDGAQDYLFACTKEEE